MRGHVFGIFLGLLFFTSLAYAANLTSCISCSQVTCPPGAVCHNIGSCPNGFVLWGCQYPNGTVVSAALPNASTTLPNSTLTTTALTTVMNTSQNTTTSIVSIPPSSTQPPKTGISEETYFLIAIVLVAVLIVYYIIISKKRMGAAGAA